MTDTSEARSSEQVSLDMWPVNMEFDRGTKTLFVDPEEFDAIQQLAHGPQEKFENWQHIIREKLGLPMGTEVKVVVREWHHV